MLCNGSCTDVMADDLNCGSCGNVCDIVNGLGGCNNGECEATLSECILIEDPPKSCSEICAESGKSCVDYGCNGVTYRWFGSGNTCEQFLGVTRVQATAPIQ